MANGEPIPPPPQPPPNRHEAPKGRSIRRTLILAFVALAVGLWLLLESVGVGVPSLGRLWPIFLGLGGLASAIDFVAFSRRPRAAGQTVLGFGLMAVLLPLTLGDAGWNEVLDWLPGVPLVIGLACLATWWADGMRRGGLLATGAVLVALGLSGFVTRIEWLQRLVPSAQVVWAVLLLVAGGVLLWRTFSARSR